MNIVVIGTGYVGLVQGACLASLGHHVVCVDTDVAKIEKLRAGVVPFFEPGLEELVKDGLSSGRLIFAGSVSDAWSFVRPEIVFLAVGTPQAEDGAADLRFVEAACRDLSSYVDGSALVVEKSTVPPGTGKQVKTWLGGNDRRVASNPEFLREGTAVQDFLHPDRVVIGVEAQVDADLLLAAYEKIDAPKLVMNRESAELAKYAANTMLASRLSLMNEFANVADAVGADILEVESVLAADPRIGAKFLRSGAGFGGSCFPKDVLALDHAAKAHGYAPKLIAPIIEVNEEQTHRFVEKIEKRLDSVDGKQLAVWGLAFNKGTDDVRESPAMKIVAALLERGAKLTVFDPQAMESAKRELEDRVAYATSSDAALDQTVALLLLTEWPEFIAADWASVRSKLANPIVFDGKNCLSRTAVGEIDLEVIGMGVCRKPAPSPNPSL